MNYYDGKWHSWSICSIPSLNKADIVSVLYSNGLRTDPVPTSRVIWKSVVAFTVVEQAPCTIQIGDMEVPEPVRECPDEGEIFWRVTPAKADCVYETCWSGSPSEKMWLRRGLIHRTREAAEAHARALIKISGGSVDE